MGNSQFIPPATSTSAVGEVVETKEFDCEVGAVVGEYVRQDAVIPTKVNVATSNSEKLPVIGRIREKTSDTECVVELSGPVIETGLGIGRVYLSATGSATTIYPTSGYRQIIGYSFGNQMMRLAPDYSVIKC